MTRRQTDPNAAKPPLPLIGRHNVTHNENSMRMEHDASAFIVGLNQVQYRLSLTNKPKSCHKTHTFCPLTLVLAHYRMPVCGGARGIRTPDLLSANETRYQLRHSPKDGYTLAPSEAFTQADHDQRGFAPKTARQNDR